MIRAVTGPHSRCSILVSSCCVFLIQYPRALENISEACSTKILTVWHVKPRQAHKALLMAARDQPSRWHTVEFYMSDSVPVFIQTNSPHAAPCRAASPPTPPQHHLHPRFSFCSCCRWPSLQTCLPGADSGRPSGAHSEHSQTRSTGHKTGSCASYRGFPCGLGPRAGARARPAPWRPASMKRVGGGSACFERPRPRIRWCTDVCDCVNQIWSRAQGTRHHHRRACRRVTPRPSQATKLCSHADCCLHRRRHWLAQPLPLPSQAGRPDPSRASLPLP